MRAVLAVFLAALVVVFAADVRYGGAALPAAGPRATLARILGDGAPHPTGSPALAAMRARIAVMLRELGVTVEERSADACGRYGTCARVHQLVARVRGRDSTGTVALVAHADAVGASGGASDDGAGVAALIEVARVTAKAPPRNDVLFVVLEGEELGLIGAEAFVANETSELRVVINLEARGSRGPAQLFQTSRAAGALVALATRGMARPVGSSLFSTIYERMPNDTDLTVFLDHGYAGLNFAFSDGVEVYHTAHDDLAHQSPGSLAHLTESALGTVSALGQADLRTLGPRQTVWFDVLGAFVIAWPAAWSLPLATLGFAGLLITALLLVRARRVRPSAIALSFVSWLGSVVLCLLGGFGVVSWVKAPASWIAHPSALLWLLFGLPVVSSMALAWAVRDRVSVEASALGIGLVHALLAVVLAHLLPGASYLLVAPTLVAALSYPLLTRRPALAIAAPALTGLLASILVLRTLYPGLGMLVAPAIPAVAALFVLPFTPLFLLLSRRTRGLAAAGLAALSLVAAIVAWTRAPFSADVPRRVNVLHVEEAGVARAVTVIDPTWVGMPWGDAPREMIAALGPDAREGSASPWYPGKAWLASVPALGLAAPEVEVLDRTGGRVRMRVRTKRNAATLIVLAAPESGLVRLDVEGASSAARMFTRGLAPGYRGLRLEGMSDVVLVAELRGGSGELILLDATDTLPAPSVQVAAARPSDALPTQDGDRTLVFRRFRPGMPAGD